MSREEFTDWMKTKFDRTTEEISDKAFEIYWDHYQHLTLAQVRAGKTWIASFRCDGCKNDFPVPRKHLIAGVFVKCTDCNIRWEGSLLKRLEKEADASGEAIVWAKVSLSRESE